MSDDERTRDVEQIAALLDGRLTGDKRAALMARLAASAELRETLGETASLLRELEGEQQPAIAPRSWRASNQRRLLIAAGIVFVAIVPAVYMMTRSGSYPLPGAASGVPAGLASVTWAEPRTRGEGGVSALSPAARAARAGALFTDLELQVAANDSAAAHTVERLIALVPDTPMSGLVIGVLRDAGTDRRLSRSERAERLTRARAAMGRLVGEERMTAGALLESARVAAFEHDSTFFRSSAGALGRARRSSALTNDERTQLAHAVDAVPSDWGLALQRLTDLLVLMGS